MADKKETIIERKEKDTASVDFDVVESFVKTFRQMAAQEERVWKESL